MTDTKVYHTGGCGERSALNAFEIARATGQDAQSIPSICTCYLDGVKPSGPVSLSEFYDAPKPLPDVKIGGIVTMTVPLNATEETEYTLRVESKRVVKR